MGGLPAMISCNLSGGFKNLCSVAPDLDMQVISQEPVR